MKSALLFLLVLASCGSCAGRQYPGQAPTMLDVSVAQGISINQKGEEEGYCTVWKLDENRIVTAGHCCVYDEPVAGASPQMVMMGLVQT